MVAHPDPALTTHPKEPGEMADPDVPQAKVCTKCAAAKPMTAFSKRAAMQDGRRSQCSACDAVARDCYRQKYPGRAAEYQRRWRESNPEASAAKQARYRQNSPEKALARFARYQARNREKIEAYREKTRERKSTMGRAYAKANPAKVLANVRVRQCALLSRTPRWLTADHKREMAALYAQAASLTKETGVPHEVDHTIPLRGKYVSGLHVPTNLRVIPRTANRMKGRRLAAADGSLSHWA